MSSVTRPLSLTRLTLFFNTGRYFVSRIYDSYVTHNGETKRYICYQYRLTPHDTLSFFHHLCLTSTSIVDITLSVPIDLILAPDFFIYTRGVSRLHSLPFTSTHPQ